MNYAQEYIPTRREKLGRRLFPRTVPNPREPKFPVRDCVFTNVSAEFSFIDRLRILVSGRVRVEVRVETENKPGQTCGNAVVDVQPPKWLERR